MSCRNEILECVTKILEQNGNEEFTIQEVIDCMRRKDSTYEDSTIRTHITSRLCTNAPDHHAVTYNDLIRTNRGTYRLDE